MTIIEGRAEPHFQNLVEVFAASFRDRPTMGAALSVYKDGEEVASVWGGIADERSGTRWTADTATVIFSCTKGLMSVLVAQLVQDGLLDYEAPVVRYWPEFGEAGKSDVTVGQLLAHRAGLSALTTDIDLDQMLDWQTMASLLAAQAPLWPPGTGYAYHALTHGWLTGELVRRVTGVSPGAYFARRIAAPLGAETWIGIPSAHTQPIAHVQVSQGLADLWVDEAAKDSPASPHWPFRAMTLGHALPAALVTPDGGFNASRVQAAEIPGAGGIATASGLAAIWSATVATTRGVRLLNDDMVARASRVATQGPPVFAPVPPFSRWGMGLQLDSEARRYLGPASFGHDGAGGQVGFADPTQRVGFAFVTNWMEAGNDPRATRIIDALRAALSARA